MEIHNLNIKERMEHYNAIGLSLTMIDKYQISKTECYGLLESGTTKNVNSNSIFNACSISKFLTSMLVMKLTEQGILDLDEDVNKILTSWKVPEEGLTKDTKVTLRNLLCHQSGIVDPEGSFTEFNSFNEIPSLVELLEGTTTYNKIPIKLNYKPVSDFMYSDAGFCIIQQVIEDVTEKPFEEVVNELIFEPLKMENSTIVHTLPIANNKDYSCGHNKNGEIVNGKYPIYPYPAAAGLWSTPSDLATLVIELMNSIKGKGNRGISKNNAIEMISAHGCKEWTGLGLFLDRSGRKIEISSFGWGVGFQCMMVAYPYQGSGLVIMTNSDLGVHQLKGIIGEIYHSINF